MGDKPAEKSNQKDLFVNELLLRIIRANPGDKSNEKSDEARLALAREALFGEARTRGRFSINDNRLLFVVANEMRKHKTDKMRRILINSKSADEKKRWEKEIERERMSFSRTIEKYKDRSPRGSDKEATVESIIHRARRKISQMGMSDQDMVVLESLFYWNSWETQQIDRILEILKNFGVSSIEGPDKNLE